MDKLYDVRRQRIKVGDIIYRCKHSALTIHKVLRLTNKGVVVSRKLKSYPSKTRWYNGRYNETPMLIEQTYPEDTYTEASLKEHNGELYLPRWGDNVMKSFIKI